MKFQIWFENNFEWLGVVLTIHGPVVLCFYHHHIVICNGPDIYPYGMPIAIFLKLEFPARTFSTVW